MSTLGTNLRFVVLERAAGATRVVVDRRRLNKETGEIAIEKNERTILDADWKAFTKVYEKDTNDQAAGP